MLYSLDTNIVIDFLRGDALLKAKMEQAIKRDAAFSITPVVAAELYKGAYSSSQKEKNLFMLETFFNSVIHLEFRKSATELFGKHYAQLKKKGKLKSEFDIMIAAITLDHQHTLITRNAKDFQDIEGLHVVVW